MARYKKQTCTSRYCYYNLVKLLELILRYCTSAMVSFTSTLLAVTTVVGALAFPTQVGPRSENEIEARSTPNQQGQSGGYFYQFCILHMA